MSNILNYKLIFSVPLEVGKFGATFGYIQGLLLFPLGVTINGAWDTIYVPGDLTKINCMQGKCLNPHNITLTNSYHFIQKLIRMTSTYEVLILNNNEFEPN